MTQDHWNDHAKQWSHIGAPLRPCLEDTELIEAFLQENCTLSEPVEALILGVTPELACLRWPDQTNLLAIDRNQAMIDGVWPQQDLTVTGTAICGDWISTPCETDSKDIVVGDGCFTLLSFEAHYDPFLQEVQRIVKPSGYFVIRHFTRPEQPENVDEIFSDLTSGKIGNFHIFKWRLAMALHGTLEQGVIVGDVWDAWNDRNISATQLANDLNWPVDAINTINNYKGVATRYSFPTVDEISSLSNQYFDEKACHFMDYELGDRCPTYMLMPKS